MASALYVLKFVAAIFEYIVKHMIVFFIAIGLAICMGGVGLIFKRERYHLTCAFEKRLKVLQCEIAEHHEQVSRRDTNLNHYHFQQYNISEALVRQPEIVIE